MVCSFFFCVIIQQFNLLIHTMIKCFSKLKKYSNLLHITICSLIRNKINNPSLVNLINLMQLEHIYATN